MLAVQGKNGISVNGHPTFITGRRDGLHAFLGSNHRRRLQRSSHRVNRIVCRLFRSHRPCFPHKPGMFTHTQVF